MSWLNNYEVGGNITRADTKRGAKARAARKASILKELERPDAAESSLRFPFSLSTYARILEPPWLYLERRDERG
jgi:hypothetical protein